MQVGGRLHRCREWLLQRRPRPARQRHWDQHAERYGVRAVVNVGHPADQFAAVTEKQKQLLLPLFRERLRGDETRLLDFGCGPGRFTADLARLATARAVGLDPTARLLSLAPGNASVSYVRARGTGIPAASGSFDAVWVCQVLGGILADRDLAASAAEIRRVLKPGGLLFVVENTSDKPDAAHWRYRSVPFYRRLFPAHELAHLADYDDLGERNSVLGGRSDE
jgi:SAM-dependent methyltransferase